MQFVVWATDRAGSLPDRQRVREAHRTRLRQPAPHAVTVLLAGPTLAVDDQQMNGTLLVVDADSLDAVRAFIDDDPYTLQGVYASVDIRPWRCGLGPLADDAGLPSTRTVP